MRYKQCSLLILGLMYVFILDGQDRSNVQYGKISVKDFEKPQSKVVDANTSGIIISDIGTIDFVGNNKGYFSHVFKRKRRVLILNKNAFALAEVRVRLYVENAEYAEKCGDIDASTYNLEGGKIVVSKLDKKDIFEDKIDIHHVEKVFTLPAVKEGSLIEYSYSVNSDFNFNLPYWQFQTNDYPCLWSEMNVEIPNLLIYAFRRQGYDSFYLSKSSVSHKSYNITDPNKENPSYAAVSRDLSVSTNTNIHRWVMKDVPGLNIGINDSYISTPFNYVDLIEFQEYQNSNGQEVEDVVSNWKSATQTLLNTSDFGGVVNQDISWFDSDLKKIVGERNDVLGSAKNIFYYVKDNFACTGRGIFANKSLANIYRAKSGNVAEINMFLTAALRQHQIPAELVILRTRSNGYNSNTYPMIDKIDYVLCRANIAGDIYYLDASNSLLGFGKIPLECYNGYARVISSSHPDSVYFYSETISEKKNTSVIIINDDKGYPSGTLQTTPGYFESYDLRQQVAKQSTKEYFKNIKTLYGSDYQLENMGIDSLSKLEFPVKIYYDFNIKSINNGDIFYFNPMLSEALKGNPFKANERKFPVEMPYPIDQMYVLNMEIPTGYVVEELPKSVKLAYNGNEGLFEYLIAKDENSVQLKSHIKLDRTNFLPDEYNTLRSFFADIVKKQSEQIVFKKKK